MRFIAYALPSFLDSINPGFASAEDVRRLLSEMNVPVFRTVVLFSNSLPHVPLSVIMLMPVSLKSSWEEAIALTVTRSSELFLI